MCMGVGCSALVHSPSCSRRQWLRNAAAAAALAPVLPALGAVTRPVRSYHVCLAPPVVCDQPDLVDIVRRAGVQTVWLAGYFYGHHPYSDDLLRRARSIIEGAGMESQLITVPLGHPGDSLGAKDGSFPLTPPTHWQTARRPDGTRFAGTSLHPPATAENVAALKHLRKSGFRRAFLDDDFRLARGPGEIGGCFCDAHRDLFLRAAGLPSQRWEEVLDDVRVRRFTPLLRAWLDFTGDELTGSFREQRRAFGGELGIMVMYLGAEKAGLRLRDYRRDLFRVGELMFDDASFGSVKGRTDELFSVLFHRRFTEPEHAYSETTAYPADRLSAAHLAAKLVISTLADVRQTMFMSGLTPFPREHWDVLAPAMRVQQILHGRVAGHRPRGPFKHYWGEAERLVGDDRPFSLWLAAGVPFEVVEQPARDGWTFVSDFDARELAGARIPEGASLVCRASAAVRPATAEGMAEGLREVFAFKRRVVPRLAGVPYVEEDHPAVCAWYPSAGRVIVWNLAAEAVRLTLRQDAARQELELGPLQAMATAGPGGRR